jgi:hypothetical protein
MTGSSISIYGLYQWDPTIFDGFTVPDGLDRDAIIENILIEFAGIEVLYPDSSFMKQAITAWSRIRLDDWTRMCKVLQTDYDPFINIRRDEVRTIEQNRNLRSTGTNTDQVSAFNTSDFSNRSKQNLNSTDSGSVVTKETFHLEGDSAITDVQDVLRKEMEVRIKYDIYQVIIEEFKKRFLVLVY